jgi:hypothetical protein
MANDAIDYINRDIVNVKNELAILTKLVRDGNGQPSLVSQVTLLNNRIAHVEIDLKNDIMALKESFDEYKTTSLKRSSYSWSFKTAIFVALITSFTSIYINWQNKATVEHSTQSDEAIVQKLDQLLKKK